MSRYENHFDIRRNTNEETANQEFEIAGMDQILQTVTQLYQKPSMPIGEGRMLLEPGISSKRVLWRSSRPMMEVLRFSIES